MDALDSPIAIASLVDHIAERLERAIMSGDLKPGSRLSEQGLAKRFGVSRGPLREAIRRLEGRKLIERKPNIGARIAMVSEKRLLDILDVREMLEGMACRLAAAHMTDDDVADLRRLVDEHGRRKEVRSGESYYQEPVARDFHYRIVRASRNEWLFDLLCGELYDLLRVYRYQSSTVPGRTRQAYDEHLAIVAALEARDGDAAERLMRQHIRNGRGRLDVNVIGTAGAAADGGQEADAAGS